jgi:hypothetical protein
MSSSESNSQQEMSDGADPASAEGKEERMDASSSSVDATHVVAAVSASPADVATEVVAGAVTQDDEMTSSSPGKIKQSTEAENEIPESVETRKKKLIEELEQHPERFWPPATTVEGNGSSELTTKNGKMNNTAGQQQQQSSALLERPSKRARTDEKNELVSLSISRGPDISPTTLDQDYVKTIQNMAEKLFKIHNAEAELYDDKDGVVLKNSNLLNALDRVQKELEKMAAAASSTTSTTSNIPSEHNPSAMGPHETPALNGGDSTIQSAPAGTSPASASSDENSGKDCHTKLATNVLGWLCLDLKRVLQAAASVSAVTTTKSTTIQDSNHDDSAKDSNVILPPPSSSSNRLTTGKIVSSNDNMSSLLCNETLSFGGAGGSDDDVLMLTSDMEDGTEASPSSVSGDDGNGGASQLLCREEGLFAGDILLHNTTTTTTDHRPDMDNGYSNKINFSIINQQLAIIRETTRLLRTKTVNLTKRRIEKSNNSNNNNPK